MKQRTGWVLIWILSLIPLLLWLLQKNDYSTIWSLIDSLGRTTSLVGIVLFAISFILSTRWTILEKLFGGLNRVYLAHHITGGIAFILILLHPVLLAFSRLTISAQRPLQLLLPTREASLYGWVSILIMFIFLYLTFFTKLPYHIWRYTHLLSGPAFLFGVLHSYRVRSDIQENKILFWYLSGLYLLGLGAYLYRLLLSQLLKRKITFEVAEVVPYGHDVIEITLKPLQKKLNYESGQFVYVSFYDPQEKRQTLDSHPFSITSIPGEENLQLVVKSLGNDTAKLMALRVGSWAMVEGPYGRFSFKNAHSRKQIWVAGGIGITPFLSMVKSLTKRDQKYEIDLYYAVENVAEAYFLDEIRKIDVKYDNLRLFVRYADSEGFLSADYIKSMSGQLHNKDILICGPKGMMNSLSAQFHEMGVPYKQIYTEKFSLG